MNNEPDKEVTKQLVDIYVTNRDKKKAWEDLDKRAKDKKASVRHDAVITIQAAFEMIPDKYKYHALKDLGQLIQDNQLFVRRAAVKAQISIFHYIVRNKKDFKTYVLRYNCWYNLHQIIHDDDEISRRELASVIGTLFEHIPDKKQSWKDIHQLIHDEDNYTRCEAVTTLGAIFEHVPDKYSAWEDLHQLSNDNDEQVRGFAAKAIGEAFNHIRKFQSQRPIKINSYEDRTWEDLIRLAEDDDPDVKTIARNSTIDILFITCPKCNKKIDKNSSYCIYCGNEFGTGDAEIKSFSFAFPEVEFAYMPSGNGSIKANLLMLGLGLPVGVFGSFIIYFLIQILAVLYAILASDQNSALNMAFGILTALILMFVSISVGHAIAYSVIKGAIIGKSRNIKISRLNGLVAGVLCFMILIALNYNGFWYCSIDGMIPESLTPPIWGYSINSIDDWVPETLTSPMELPIYIDFLFSLFLEFEFWRVFSIWALLALAICVIPIRDCGNAIKNAPFCEKCDTYMKKTILGKIPVSEENKLINVLTTRQFTEIFDISVLSGDSPTYSEIELWYCEECNNNGIINAKTIQMRNILHKDTKYKITTSRLIFSDEIVDDDIKSVLNIRRKVIK